MLTVSTDEVLNAHEIRNSIVYNPDYMLSTDQAKKILDALRIRNQKYRTRIKKLKKSPL